MTARRDLLSPRNAAVSGLGPVSQFGEHEAVVQLAISPHQNGPVVGRKTLLGVLSVIA